MSQFVSVKEATQLTGRSEKTIRRWLKRVRTNDQAVYNLNVQAVDQAVGNLVNRLYTIDRDFLLKTFRLDNVQAVDQANDQAGVQAGELPGSGILDYLKEAVREKDTLIRQLIDTQARERERVDTIIMSMRKDIADLSSRLALQAPKEEPAPVQDQVPEPGPKQTPEPEARPPTGQPGPGPEPGKPEEITATFADGLWFIGQSIKRFLGKKIW